MVGALGQDLATDPLRLGRSAGLVMPDGDPHRLIDRDLRHESCGFPVSVYFSTSKRMKAATTLFRRMSLLRRREFL